MKREPAKILSTCFFCEGLESTSENGGFLSQLSIFDPPIEN